MVSWWRAEGNALDEAGGHNGTLVGSTMFGPGEFGEAFVFSGNGDGVSVGSPLDLQLQDFTIEAWIKRSDRSRASQDPAGGGSGAIFLNNWGAYGLGLADDGRLILTKVGYDGVFSTNLRVADVSFHHAAVTKHGSNVVFYVDGLAEAAPPYGSVFEFGGPWAIGARGGDYAGSFWGSIDEISVYNRPLSLSEIQDVYRAAGAGKCMPFIISQPADQTAWLDSQVKFGVTAGGTPPLSYQWLFNGSALTGATNSALEISSVAFTNAGLYAVTVASSDGSVTSRSAQLTVTPLPPCAPAPDGLVSWWRGQGNAWDEHGGNNGTLIGNATFAAGEVGQGFIFDGSADGVSVGAPVNLQLQNFTIEAWIKRSDTALASQDPAGSGSGAIFASSWGGYGLAIWDAGNLVLTKIGYDGVVSTNLKVLDTAFHHVAVTKNGSTVAFYLDGVEETAMPYNSTFEFGGPWAIGGRGNDYVGSFSGSIDELSVYNRALSPLEIQAIYEAAAAGKCIVSFAPLVLSQPSDHIVQVNSAVALTVSAGGTQPMTYQWLFNEAPLPGATNSTLEFSNVAFANAGTYAVRISNSAGTTISSNASLIVTFPPAVIRVLDTTANSGGTATVPILLGANGNENAVGFSLSFASSLLRLRNLTLGTNAVGASLLINTNQAAAGSLGVALSLPVDATFPAGTQELVEVTFDVPVLTNSKPQSALISFSDSPTVKQLSDARAHVLNANYVGGSVSIGPAALEGDVAPRPSGDYTLTVADWVLEGRYVARVDYPTNASEFQRADAAPRSTFGDGLITASDWVQVGRYVAGLDPLALAAGPASEGLLTIAARPKADNGGRRIEIVDSALVQKQTGSVPVRIEAQGGENAVAFSIAFDPAIFRYSGASPGNDMSSGTLILNTNQAESGRIALALALPPGQGLAVGTRELVRVTFRAAPTASGQYAMSLTDQPVPREVSDLNAVAVRAEYVGASIAVINLPLLQITRADRDIQILWPLAVTGFVIQEATGELMPSTNWTNLTLTPTSVRDQNVVTLPLSGSNRFYRLFRP
jgi:hypothetical protein